MPNPKLEIRKTIACFPPELEHKPGVFNFNLFSLREVALREQQLRLVQSELDLGPRFPAHYLLYGSGMPKTREQSRIGGLPYRPRDIEWPEGSDGRPKEFICQIDFSDSRSLLPELPGQIMLLFAEEDEGDTGFSLEWYPSGLTNLVSARELPGYDFTFPMVCGVPVICHLYETYDYPEAISRIKGTRFEKWEAFGLPCGGKIAGFGKSTQPGDKHILTIESIRFIIHHPYPFVPPKSRISYISERLSWKFASLFRKVTGVRNPCYDVLMIGDMGRIEVVKDAVGQIQVRALSY